MKSRQRVIWFFLLLMSAPAPLLGQDDPPATPFTFSILVQNTFQESDSGSGPLGTDGFRMRRIRPKISGHVLPNVHFVVIADLVRDFPLLQTRITWTIAPSWDVLAGLYKVPFSMEFLENVGRLDFVMRSRVVRRLSPGRDTGISIRKSFGDRLAVQVGAFNGVDGATFVNDNNSYLYAGRVLFTTGGEDIGLRLAANVGYSQDENAPIKGISPTFDGNRALLGGGLWFDLYAWTVKAESIYVDTNKPLIGNSGAFSGGYITLQRRFGSDWVSAIRWDRYVDTNRTDDLVAGITWGPLAPVKVQADVHVPLNQIDSRSPVFLMMAQIAL